MDLDSNCRWLVLVPTEFELAKMQPHWPSPLNLPGVTTEVCGFGPIATAARTAQLIARNRPQNVLLIGIAGSYTDQLPVGSATQFKRVDCYGIGVGQGENFESANRMGWAQYSSADQLIGDQLGLSSTDASHHLLTCTAASENQDEARLRLSVIPDASAEDMEGFGMAMACELANITQRFIIRGISNRAGDRNKQNWQIDQALRAACQLAGRLVAAR